MKWLYLFRHGETNYNREHRFQGHLDIPLNHTGKQQARTLIQPLRKIGIECILSSDLSRARETAEIVAGALQVPVFTSEGLREAHLGNAEGLTAAEIESKFGTALVERWKSPYLSDADVSYPGGETGKAVLTRVLNSIETFIVSSPHSRIGVATHGGVIRRVIRAFLGENAPFIPIPNGILYPVQHHPKDGWIALNANPISETSSQD